MSHKPLSGRRVIELGTMVAAPFATHILSQLGAEVIKVEPPTGDTTRALVRGGPGGTFIAYNHGKKSLSIDLTTKEGSLVFHKLAATADVVIHNLSPAATRKLGITAGDLKKDYPELIYCHIRGYAKGPQHDDLATNPVAEASTGVMADNIVGGRPSRLGPSYHDQFAGAYAVIRVLATMLNTEPSAKDRDIEIGLYETGLHIAGRDLAGVQLKTQLLGRPEKEAGGEFAMPGYGAYKTSDGRWIYLLVLTDAHWKKLSQGLGMPEADDLGLAHLRERKKQRDRVEAAVRNSIGDLSYGDAVNKLTKAGVGYTEVLPLERVLEAPQARYSGKLRNLDFGGLHFEVPEFPGYGEVDDGLAPPHLGQHTVEIMEQLGFDQETCGRFLDKGALIQAKEEASVWAPKRKDK